MHEQIRQKKMRSKLENDAFNGADLRIIKSMIRARENEIERLHEQYDGIDDRGFDVYETKSYVIKCGGHEVLLDRDEAIFLVNELRIMLMDQEEEDE